MADQETYGELNLFFLSCLSFGSNELEPGATLVAVFEMHLNDRGRRNGFCQVRSERIIQHMIGLHVSS